MKLRMLHQNLEEILCGAFLLTMILIVIANVLLRYFSDFSLYWAEEVATICFVWAVFVGAAACFKHKMHIGIDILVKKATPPLQGFLTFIASSILLLINGYLFVISIVFTSIAFDKPTAVLGVSSAVVNAALIVGFGLTCVHSLRFWYADWQALNAEKP